MVRGAKTNTRHRIHAMQYANVRTPTPRFVRFCFCHNPFSCFLVLVLDLKLVLSQRLLGMVMTMDHAFFTLILYYLTTLLARS